MIGRFDLTAAHAVQSDPVQARATVRFEGYEAMDSSLAFRRFYPLVFGRILYEFQRALTACR